MILMFCGVLLFVACMTMSLTTLAVVPSLCYTFYQVLVVLFDIVGHLITFYWNVLLFITGIIRETIRIVGPVFNDVMPLMCLYVRDLYSNIKEVVVTAWRTLWHFALQREEGFVAIWGPFVAFVYFYWNQVMEILRNNQAEDRTDNVRRTRNRLYPDLDEIDNYINNTREVNDLDLNVNAEDSENARLIVNDRLRQGQLYPQLDGSTPYVNEDRKCVVCFDRDRNTAVFPCGHTHTCMQCTLAIIGTGRKLCPICQQRITEHRRIFV